MPVTHIFRKRAFFCFFPQYVLNTRLGCNHKQFLITLLNYSSESGSLASAYGAYKEYAVLEKGLYKSPYELLWGLARSMCGTS